MFSPNEYNTMLKCVTLRVFSSKIKCISVIDQFCHRSQIIECYRICGQTILL
jgi:hypothetical protein